MYERRILFEYVTKADVIKESLFMDIPPSCTDADY